MNYIQVKIFTIDSPKGRLKFNLQYVAKTLSCGDKDLQIQFPVVMLRQHKVNLFLPIYN